MDCMPRQCPMAPGEICGQAAGPRADASKRPGRVANGGKAREYSNPADCLCVAHRDIRAPRSSHWQQSLVWGRPSLGSTTPSESLFDARRPWNERSSREGERLRRRPDRRSRQDRGGAKLHGRAPVGRAAHWSRQPVHRMPAINRAIWRNGCILVKRQISIHRLKRGSLFF